MGPQGQAPYGAALTDSSIPPRDLFGGKQSLGLPWLSSSSLALNSFKLRTRVYLFPSGPDTLQRSCQPALQLCPQQINVQLRAAMKTSAGGRVGRRGLGSAHCSPSLLLDLSPSPPDLQHPPTCTLKRGRSPPWTQKARQVRHLLFHVPHVQACAWPSLHANPHLLSCPEGTTRSACRRSLPSQGAPSLQQTEGNLEQGTE